MTQPILDCVPHAAMRLGGTADLLEPFPEKPRGMHRQTHLRLRARAEAQGIPAPSIHGAVGFGAAGNSLMR